MKFITDTMRHAVNVTTSSLSLLAPWGPGLSSFPKAELNNALEHHRYMGSLQGKSQEELVAIARVTLWWSLFVYGLPLLMGIVLFLCLLWKARFRCQDLCARRPQWLVGKFLLHFTSVLNIILTLSTILSWTQQHNGFPRSFVEWLLRPIYLTLEFLVGPSLLDFATHDLGVNMVPLALSLLCSRLNRKLQVWMLGVREWEDGEGWASPGRNPLVRIDLGNPVALRKLKAMGFEERKAERALALSNNDVDMAAARLLEQKG